jgi:double-stranded uracil-DNA glycosylase
MSILPDLLAPGLDLVVVGTAAGRTSAERQCYYAGRGNRFWRTLHGVSLTAIELRPDEYTLLLDHGIGLTDLAKGALGADADLKPEDFDRMRLRSVIKAMAPRIVAFNGKTAAARFLNVPTAELGYGRLPATIGRSAVYVCPSTSPASGHWSRGPWEELARAVKER